MKLTAVNFPPPDCGTKFIISVFRQRQNVFFIHRLQNIGMNYPAASGRGIRYFIKSENLIGFPTPFPFKETPPQGAGVLKIKINLGIILLGIKNRIFPQ